MALRSFGKRLGCAFVFSGLATACVSESAGYSDARTVIANRTGHDARWNRLDRTSSERRVSEIVARPLNAESAMQVALLNNPEVQRAFEEIGVARAGVVSALALPNPVAEGAMQFHGDGKRPDLEVTVTASLSRLIFLPLRSGAARSELDAAKLSTAASVIDIAFEARTAYYRFVAAKQIVELRRTVLLAAKASEEAARGIHDAGNSSDLELAGEKALYEEARLAVADAEANLVTEREALNVAMGFWSGTPSWTTEPRLGDPPPGDAAPTDAERRAIRESLDLEISRRRFTAAAKRANVSRAEGLLPEVRAGAAIERESDEARWGVGPAVVVEVPLFYQGQGEVARARAEMRREEQSYGSLAVQIRSAARSSSTRLETAARRARFYKSTLLPLKERVLNETELHYNAMGVGVFQLLSAKRDQVETARMYVETLRDYWIARAELDQLMAGRLVRSRTTSSPSTSDVSAQGRREAH